MTNTFDPFAKTYNNEVDKRTGEEELVARFKAKKEYFFTEDREITYEV